MRKLVEKIFRRYGVPITVQETSGISITYGFLENMATSAKRHILPEYSPLGQIPQGHYLMLLPINKVRVGKQVMYNGKMYIMRRVERVCLGSTAIYDWCLCEERGETDKWGQ